MLTERSAMSHLVMRALLLALWTLGPLAVSLQAAELSPDTDLRLLTLESSDLGSGYRLNLEQSGPRPNEAGPREDLQRYQQWGRVSGYSVQFEREGSALADSPQTRVVIHTVSLYRTASGAQAAMDYSRQRNGQTLEALSIPPIGEAALAFRLRQPASQGAATSGLGMEAVVIQFRQGNVVESVIVSGLEGSPALTEAVALAQLAASRLPN
jgi:hypothetical protein